MFFSGQNTNTESVFSFICTTSIVFIYPSALTYPTDIDAPTNLATREVTENSATVTWDSVRAEIDGYMLTYSSAEGTSGEIKVGADATSYQLTSLKPGVLYTVFLWAYKGSRSSRKSMTEAETGKLFTFWLRMWGFTLSVFISSSQVFPQGILPLGFDLSCFSPNGRVAFSFSDVHCFHVHLSSHFLAWFYFFWLRFCLSNKAFACMPCRKHLHLCIWQMHGTHFISMYVIWESVLQAAVFNTISWSHNVHSIFHFP